MQTSITDAGKYEKLLTLQVAEAELEEAKTRAAQRLSRELKIKGFRPGRAPRRIVEATVGPERLRSEAIDDLLPTLVGDALRETDLEPAVIPRVENMTDVDAGLEVEIRVTMWPTLDSVPEYRGIEVEVVAPGVTDEEVETQLDRFREQFADLETVGRPAAEGDFTAINLSATHHGQPVEDASVSDLLYEVGSGDLVEGIDDQLVGKAAGDIVKFTGPLPAGFGDDAGREVTFQVLVKEVKTRRLPEVTDAWAAEVTEFETVDELRKQLARRMAAAKQAAARDQLRAGILEALLAEIDLDIPEGIIAAEAESILHGFVHRLEGQGISLADYMRVTGQSQQVLLDDVRNQADRNVRTDLLLQAVASQEGIEVADEEVTEVIEALAAGRDEKADGIRSEPSESVREKVVRGDILKRKALDALIEGAVAVDESGSRIDLSARDEEETAAE